MSAMYFLIPLALLLLAAAIWAFLWAVRRDQFDQMDSAALSIFDDEPGDSQPSRKPPE